MRKFFYLALAVLVLVLSFEAFLIFSRKKSSSTNEALIGLKQNFISTIVVPHFEGASEERVKYFKQISSENQFSKVVLISTNHYNTGASNVISTKSTFELKDAKVIPDDKLVQSLVQFAGATDDKNSFLNEHGINSVLPDINKYFVPKNITPIILREGTTKEEVEKVFNTLKDSCSGCLVVSSIDFSHYNPNSLAQIHDQMSLAALANLDEQKAWLAETDSPPTLALTVKWAKSFTGQGFSLYKNSNSAADQKNDTIEATSYIIGSFSDQKANPRAKQTTFIFAGDMMLDRYIYHRFQSNLNDVFARLGNRVFWGTDISFLNNEGPISKDPINDDYTANNLIFNFPPKTPSVLNFLHVNGVSLANNHSLNAGQNGFQDTVQLLDENKIKHCGSQNVISEDSVVRYDSDIPVSVVCFNQLEAPALSKISDLISVEKKSGRFVVVYPHWGNEYQTKHNGAQQKLAEDLIDGGADMIVGSHPHVVQDFDIYKGKPIIYSLGNLVFDQSFSRETQEGLIVAGVIKEDSVEISFLPTRQVNLLVQLENDQSTKQDRISNIFNINDQSGFTKLTSDTIKVTR